MSRLLWFGASGAAVLLAALAALVALQIGRDRPTTLPSGPHVFEGTVQGNETVTDPNGQPMVYGYVEISARERDGGGWEARPLVRAYDGYEDVRLVTDDGEARTVDFSDPLEQFKSTDFDVEVVESLQGHPAASQVPDWKAHQGPGGFMIRVLAVRPGDRLLVETDGAGQVQQAWFGGREGVQHHREDTAAAGERFALFLWLLAGLLVVAGFGLAIRGLFG